jgi:transposase InsO family protein
VGSASSTCPTWTPLFESWRRDQKWSASRIAHELAEAGHHIHRPTVTRHLNRLGLGHRRFLDPSGEPNRIPGTITARWPGHMVHLDVKKVGRIPDGGGWKAHGRQIGKTSVQKKARIGFDYIHSVVDDHSRLAYSEVLPNEQGPTCGAFLLRAAAYFAGHGIVRIERVMTDNHWSYSRSTDVTNAMAALGARHVFIRPHCPWQNGKVERYNRTLQVEWAYRQIFLTNDDRTAALAPWLEFYNTGRRHSAIGGLPPISRLS